MTRGTLHIITDKEVISTTEFNGSMYPDGSGDIALEMLREVNSREELSLCAMKFAEQEFGNKDKEEAKTYIILPYLAKHLRWDMNRYTDKELGAETRENKNMLDNWKKGIIDFNIDYFKYWYSDWIFFKNLSDRNIVFILEDDTKTYESSMLAKGETIRFSFGKVYKDNAGKKHRDLLTKTLEEIKTKKCLTN